MEYLPINLKSNHISVQGSKSIINRVLIISTFLKNSIQLSNFSNCEDVNTLSENLKNLGFTFTNRNQNVIITSPAEFLSASELYLRDSATALRFLLAQLASIPNKNFVLKISKQLQKRPILQFLEILKQMGADIIQQDDKFIINGKHLKSGVYHIPANISSQFISSLLLISPAFTDGLSLVLQNSIVSETYIDLTIKVMSDFGVIVNKDKNVLRISKNQNYQNITNYSIEPDYSSLAYFWALGTLNKNFITTDFQQNSSFQSDYRFISVLKKMGAEIVFQKNKIKIRFGNLHGIDINMKNMPDQVPTLAILALLADSPTYIRNISHLKYKETDRISALISEIKRIGGFAKYDNVKLYIKPLINQCKNVKIDTYDDHRMVMAFSILQKVFPQIQIDTTKPVNKSNPDFFKQLKSIS
ncbi:MAG: 3-phosphoshikimate 1-carboxyvinyltransferase [Candidatus Cloacimonetes bacterium]|nr:3-phosphoshikimate 1-carboxyvinyltransferase [Candidatus Cloacimonadota bacterium]